MKRFYLITFLIYFTASTGFTNSDFSYEECLRKAYQAQSVYQIEQAEQWFRKALELGISDPAIQLALARTLFAQLKNDEALEQVEKVLEKNSNHAQAHYFLCRFYWKVEQNIEKAEQHGRLAAQNDLKHVGARTLLGEIYISQRKYSEAEKVYRELIEINNKSTEAYVGLGNALVKQEKYEQGIKILKRAVKIDPKYPEPHRILTTAYAKNGDRENAKNEQKQYQTLKTKKQYIENLLRDLHEKPENAQLWFDLGKEYLRQRYPTEKAIEAIKKGLHFNKNHPQMHNLIGTLYLNDDQVELAKKHLLYSISLDPENANVYNNLGVACMLNDEYKEAVTYLKKSIKLGNKDPGVKRNLEFVKMKLKEKQSSSQP